jgi:hypothetical protein
MLVGIDVGVGGATRPTAERGHVGNHSTRICFAPEPTSDGVTHGTFQVHATFECISFSRPARLGRPGHRLVSRLLGIRATLRCAAGHQGWDGHGLHGCWCSGRPGARGDRFRARCLWDDHWYCFIRATRLRLRLRLVVPCAIARVLADRPTATAAAVGHGLARVATTEHRAVTASPPAGTGDPLGDVYP